MNQRIRLHPLAEADIENQSQYMCTHAGLSTAIRFHDAVSAALDMLGRSPVLGSPYPSANPALSGMRIWQVKGFKKHFVFYRETEDGIDVVRILHGHRDISSLFEAGSSED